MDFIRPFGRLHKNEKVLRLKISGNRKISIDF